MTMAEAKEEPEFSNPKCGLCGFRHPKFDDALHHKCESCGRLFPSKIGLEFHEVSHKKKPV